MAEEEVTQEESAEVTATETEEDEPLGPKGQKALDAMKEQLKAARADAKAGKAAATRLAELEASSMSEQEKAVKAAREEAAAEVRSEVLRERLGDKIEAAMAGRFSVPASLLNLNPDEFIVDGQIDTAAIKAAVDGLLTTYPNLAVGEPARFQGTADQGARGGQKATPAEAIAEAEAKGDFQTARSLKAAQLLSLPQS